MAESAVTTTRSCSLKRVAIDPRYRVRNGPPQYPICCGHRLGRGDRRVSSPARPCGSELAGSARGILERLYGKLHGVSLMGNGGGTVDQHILTSLLYKFASNMTKQGYVEALGVNRTELQGVPTHQERLPICMLYQCLRIRAVIKT